ncbi:ankyrin repeat domain-containing protein 6-like [Argiope bruennichi]|uniref:ankyrin repeat domain-containing protein 6-like n=1 Tax=Argiope bruennichi TaxID=94029 RepID=UPI00249439A3|nr:ankyrin repeat domain-containing protein 6-like [Argiope bruennichi]
MDFFRISIARFIFSDQNLDVIRAICAEGIDLNLQSDFGMTLFHDAVNIPDDNIGIVQEFIHAGADVNISTFLDLTPLHFAVFHRKRRVVDALIHSGAFVNAQTFLGTTSLHIAVSKSIFFCPPIENVSLPDIWIINKLLSHEDIDCNLVDSNGDSSLMVAVKEQQTEAVVKLLHHNADPNIPNKDGVTPLHVAFTQLSSHIELQLLIAGANIYSVDKMGQTPMDILINYGLDFRSNEWVMLIINIIAFKYNITNDLKQKLEYNPHLLQFLNKCIDEVDQMKNDFVSGSITMHDFIWNCFNEDEFLLLEIHKAVVDRLVKDIYIEYFIAILDLIPESSLIDLLEITANSKKHTKGNKMSDLANIFTKFDIILLISDYLSKVEIFCLIVAFSNVKIADSLKNVYEREFSYFFDMNWENE